MSRLGYQRLPRLDGRSDGIGTRVRRDILGLMSACMMGDIVLGLDELGERFLEAGYFIFLRPLIRPS